MNFHTTRKEVSWLTSLVNHSSLWKAVWEDGAVLETLQWDPGESVSSAAPSCAARASSPVPPALLSQAPLLQVEGHHGWYKAEDLKMDRFTIAASCVTWSK